MEDALYVALSALGIYGYVQSGGVLNLSVLMPFIYSIAGEGVDLHGYITQDEEAGTTTISADFVNLVLQAYKQYKEENAGKFDGTLDYNEETMRYIYGNSEYHLSALNNTTYDSHISGFESYYPVAFLLVPGTTEYKYSRWGTSGFNPDSTSTGYGGFLFYYNLNPDASNDGIELAGRFPDTLVKKPTTIMYNNGVARDPMEGFYVQNISGPGVNDPYFVSFNSSTIPVYTSFDMMKEAFHSGDYSHAENYSVGVPSGETPSYTGEYTGGDITVPTEKLEGIQDKLDEIDKTDKDIYEKLKELLEWLLGNGGIGGGTDMTATNSWLEKIYLKVCQIYDKMNSAVVDTEQAALTKIQESLDEIIVQLKKIKRWTAIDTVVDGVDAIADWLDLIRGVLKDAKEGAGSAVSAIASGVGDSVDLMAKKFPFSIPWDILFFVSALSAEPQVPHFEIPFNIELSALDITIDYTMELDFSQLQWLSDLSRLLLSMTYAVGLMKLTFGVTSVGKEE